MRKIVTNKYFLYSAGILLFFIIWEVISLCVGNPVALFPDPIRTIQESFNILGSEYFYKCLLQSLIRMFIGFFIAFAAALILGIIAGNIPSLQKVFAPTMTILKAVPTAALVFLFLTLMGAKNAPILIVILICFPILYEAVIAGFNGISLEIKEAMSLDSNNEFKNTFKIKLPLSMPYIIVGISSSFALSFKIEIMAEIISGDTGYGLGVAISYAQSQNASNLVPVFAYAFLSIVLMLIITLIAGIIKKKIKRVSNYDVYPINWTS